MIITADHIGAALGRIENRLDDYLLSVPLLSPPRRPPTPRGHHLGRHWR